MLGIHKVQDAVALRLSVQAAIAEARLAEQVTAVNFERSHPVSSVTDHVIDSEVPSTTVSANESTTAACILAGIQAKPDAHLAASAGHLLAVVTLSQDHTDTRASLADTLPHYFLIDPLRSVDSHQHKL